MKNEYEGQERRRNPTIKEGFEAAVEYAAEQAAQRVARIHRLRLVRWTFLASLITMTVVTLIVWFAVFAPEQRQFSKQNALYDCKILKESASAMGNFVNESVRLRIFQNSPRGNVGKQLIIAFEKVIPTKLLKSSINQNTTLTNEILAAWVRDKNVLLKLGGTDCIAHLKG